ncbi:MAG TPA: PQQ-binding-like beta-propeller repeat protein [Steroidobacteraceae bacterium]
MAAGLPVTHAADAPPPGKVVYEKHCASCHDHPETRAPAFDTLKGMRYGSIHYALTEGKMQLQGAPLSMAERASVIDFLVGRSVVDDAWVDKMMCAPGHRTVDLEAAATVTSFGFDVLNHRHLTREQAGLATSDMAGLQLAWALAFPKVTTLRAQAAVVGNTLFLPVGDVSQLYAIDISGDKPCFKWVYQNDIPLRTGAAYGTLPDGRKVLVFGDIAPIVHMIDATTGKEIWHRSVRLTSLSNGTATPVLYKDRVYVPLSASEINFGADEKHECCKTHGAVFALDARTGRVIWSAHTMADAKPQGDRGDGQQMWGPSGAPIWNSPSIDEKRGVLYVGTGEATSAPAEPTTDAILALDLKTGKRRWHFQATKDDIFLTGCLNKRDGLNCPKKSVMLDVDFGAGTILAKRPTGHDVVLAGQKSSTLWALDPDNEGRVLWSRNFGPGSIAGGIHWGLAYDGKYVFAPVSVFPGPDGKPGPGQVAGLHAVEVDTGRVAWSFEPQPDCSGDRPSRIRNCAGGIGLSGAATVIDGAVLAGSLDGFLRAFDAATGKLLFQFDTAREYETLNGVPGKGGAIDNASIVAANGYVFVNSGYGLLGNQTPGNVFLAFRPGSKLTARD